MTKEQIKEGLDKAYEEAGHNAYFGNGFEAGVKFVLNAQKTAPNTAYTKMPSNKTLREFIGDYNVCSDEFGGDDALNMVKDALYEYGNFI